MWLTRILSKAFFLWTETFEELDLTWVFQYYIFAATHNHCQDKKFTKQVVQFNFCHFLVVIRAAAGFKPMGSRAAREASSIQWKYHIFLSFRGEDTRNGFTSHLHKALKSRGYDVFMDEDDVQVGQVIKPELLQAIENSKISVIVLSTKFADSSWCLDELVKIMECRRTLNQIVLPIFYSVDPSNVRHQTGTLASDFQKHTKQHKDEVIKEWRKALTEAANLCGEDLKDRNEAKFIEAFIENNIVGRLSTTPLPVAAYPVGVDSRAHDMISYILGGGSQDVVVIGIWGMAGLGKTTAAKAIYNRIKDKFEAHGFLGDIRDTANRHGLIYLQKQLLAKIYKKPTIDISCVDGGMGMIKEKLGRKRVLVIIDDVDKQEQLEAIVGNRDWFGSGSRIIITTRDKHFLDVLRVNKTFTVPEMNPDEGLELFCWHAFQKGCPNKRYLELSKKVVSYSGGLPLALKVLGSFLVGRTIEEWESQLEELEGIPPKDILKQLRISYDGLDHIEKCIFLDISCFFIGMNKDHVKKILDGCGYKAEIKISVLLQRCLVTVNEENQLTMHDLLREMGRAICQEDRSRLWLSPDDLTDVLEDKSGTKKVERLALNLRSSEKASFGTEAFSKMRKLKLLQLNYVELTGEYKFLSKNLRWLCWHGFLLDSIPGDFDLTSLIAMDLQFSKLKVVWKDCKLLKKLTIINLSHSHDLTTSPDFSKVPNLEELILECTSLSDVHESIGDLKRLALVNLEHCKMLKDLPLNLYRSKSIETLLLNGCSRFENLAEGLGDMVSLRTLEADDTAVTKIPSSIVKLKNLRSLSLCGLERLTGFLPHSYLRSSGLHGLEGSQPTGFLPPLLDGLNSLRKLALADCSLTDDEFPKDLGSLSSLEHLDCGQNSFCRLPSLRGLSKLEYLCLNDCRKLRAIPELPTNLKVLRGFGCTALETMPDFSEMSSIREVYLSDSCKLTEIPGLDKSLNSVTRIHMEGCTNLTTNFRKKILQGWTSCGFGGIYLEGIFGIPKWFKLVGNEYNEVDFEVPQNFGCDLKGLTLCCVYSSDNPKPKDGLGIMVRNVTQGTTLHTWPAIASVKTDSKPEDYYLWQGQLSNNRLSLQGGDKVLLSVFATVDFVKVKKAGFNLEWDKVMKENMHDSDPHLYDLDPNPDWLSRTPDEAGPIQGEPLRESVLASCNLTDTAIYNDYAAGRNLKRLMLKGCKNMSEVYSVGITSWVRDLSDQLDLELSEKVEKAGSTDVRMIGILGMGSVGKTMLAKTIYNKFERIFEGRSFLANVREVIAHQPITGLVGLLEQLLNDILKSKDPIKVDSVEVGIDMIRARISCKRALVIIDDADDLQQLKVIAEARDCFGPGSRIVITTRNKHLLEQVGVDSIYMAEEMDEKEALELWHAFESCYPNQEYLDLSKRVIRYCQGLPLALEVLGSFLKERTTSEWESHPDGDIQKVLRINFYSLPDDTTRDIFLDISCFFIGMDKEYVTQILDGCGFYATIGISVLIERCLVTVSKQNKLIMHDLLRDMGREIVRKNAHGHPEKFSRLWKHEDVRDVLSNEFGTEKIEGVALDCYYKTFSAQAFTNMKKLRLLHISGVELTGECKDFPKKLIWLCWHRFPLESIPDDFPMQPKLVALDLQFSELKIVWKDCKLHQNLKILNLSHSRRLTKSPDFSKLPNLEELILQYCVSLSEVHSSIGDLGRLSLVNIQSCRMLKDLPLNFYKSKSIETLLLTGCSSFEKLAEGLGDMVSLTTLEADETAVPSSIFKLKKLKVLSLCNVKGSPSTNLLRPSLQSLSSLRELALTDWSLTDDAFPKDLSSLISLENLDLAGNDFCRLPSLSRLSKLHDLSLNKCKNLRAIPDLPTNLKVLKADGCIALEKMPDFSEMSNIRELHLRDSGKLTEIPGLDKSLNSMTWIHMEDCTNLTADFRNNILQGWTSCGYGGISISGNDIPDWFDCVHDDDIVYSTVPQSGGRNLKGLTLSSVYSLDSFNSSHMRISIKNMTEGTELDVRITPLSSCRTEGYYLWQGQLSNDELKLQDGDKVLIEIIPEKGYRGKVKKTGVSLVWDKIMNENMIDYHLCAYERRPYLVNDDDIIHIEYDNHITKSPDFSEFPNLEKLILKSCKCFYKVHSSIGHLERLSLVNLEDCEMLRDLPLNFYKSKSIETLILNGCSRFEDLADGLGDMVSLKILRANKTSIRRIPSSIVKLKNLEHLLLANNYFRSLPSLAGLLELKVLCLNACRKLVAIPDLPTNLYVLKAVGCPELETIPDFSKMWNMRELYLSDSFKLTEVPGLDKSLNSMTRIHMEDCTNLTADFRNNILQGWTSSGYGGIYLNGIYDIPEWFEIVSDVDNIVFFEVPQTIMGRDFKGLTICFVYSKCSTSSHWYYDPIGIIVRNLTQRTALHTKIAFASLGTCSGPEDDYLWHGQLSNDVLCLQGGDRVSILVKPDDVDFVRVKKTGIHLEWDKVMKENMDNPDPHLYDWKTNGS
ncbi:unnamed protein product [Prunus armeniaca]